MSEATDFWSANQVGGPYDTLEKSRKGLAARAALFPALEQLMPTAFSGVTVLDYGCGPGHDTIQFAENRNFVFYTDVSPLAIRYTLERIKAHNLQRQTAYIKPFQFVDVDYIHCAGVLHHIEEPLPVLQHFRRLLHVSGAARVMIYDGDRSQHSQSKVPVTYWWGEAEFTLLAEEAGFDVEYLGSYECSAVWRPNCYAACYRLT